jgi:hypothetical protein
MKPHFHEKKVSSHPIDFTLSFLPLFYFLISDLKLQVYVYLNKKYRIYIYRKKNNEKVIL